MTSDKASIHPYDVRAPEQINRVPMRPLGKLSDYAALQLPADIAAVRGGNKNFSDVANTFDELADGLHPQELNEKDLSLALYDATVLESALRALRAEQPAEAQSPDCTNLQTLTKKLARLRGIVPHLSYEGLIFANPLDNDPRTFLAGDMGRQELLFYKLHALIEEEFRMRIPIILEIIRLLSANEKDHEDAQILKGFDEFEALLLQISRYMREFHTLVSKSENGAFHQARPFWNATEKYQGPSGKFSAGYFLMDSLLSGSDPSMKKFLRSKLHELAYYPNTTLSGDGFAGQDDMLLMFAQVQEGNDLTSMALNSSDPLVSARLKKIIGLAEQNRSIHIGLASGFLPEAYKKGESGTGEQGMSMKQYLDEPRSAYAQLFTKVNS